MEQALILGKISYRAPDDVLEKIKKIKGVKEANIIFGPYDFYITITTETKKMMGDIAIQIRALEGIVDTLTCYVVNHSDIRPDAQGSFIE